MSKFKIFSFSIIIGVRGIDETCDHIMDIIFKDSSGSNLVVAKNMLISADQLKEGDQSVPEDYRGIVVGMDLRNVIIKQEGVYCTEVYFDGKNLGDFDIYVKAK